jgi:hypothetical protein
MMNTLANHGFLPHNGRNITEANIISGLGAALNFDSALASLMFRMAIIANPEPNATFFTLYVSSSVGFNGTSLLAIWVTNCFLS